MMMSTFVADCRYSYACLNDLGVPEPKQRAENLGFGRVDSEADFLFHGDDAPRLLYNLLPGH